MAEKSRENTDAARNWDGRREAKSGHGQVQMFLFLPYAQWVFHFNEMSSKAEALFVPDWKKLTGSGRVLERLVGALEVPLLRVNAARILRNLCTYSGADCFDQLKGITAAVPTVLNAVMSEENKLQEVMVGLAAEAFKFMTSQESNTMFNGAGIKEAELANKILQILKRYQNPSVKVPRIRRFSIELAIWMMQNNAANVRTFKDLGLRKNWSGFFRIHGRS
ncbi:hypothetical protein NC652_022382 [Populus alba x Populus x berolinensis]|nr:hypothetical protein NC652_022382 [Populus alba x Populus x berolinensis]